MGRPFTGKKSVSVFEEQKGNGTIYVYERTTWYDQEKKYTRSQKRLIGKKDILTGEVKPTRPRKDPKRSGEEKDIQVGRKSNAMISILQFLSKLSGVTEEVKKATKTDRGTAEKMLTLAWFTLATEGRTWTRAENWTSSHMSELPYSYGPITESIYQELFVYLGKHDDIKWSIFRQRANKLGDGDLLALDSTLIDCENSTVYDAKKVKDKEGLITGAYKVIYLYSITGRQLVAYAKIPGNIPDCSTVGYALDCFKALNLRGTIEIVQDNGYATVLDIGQYLHAGRHFITRIEPNASWIRDEVDKYLPMLKEGKLGTKIIREDPEFTGIKVTVTHKFPYIRKRGSKAKGLKAGDRDYITAKINVFIYYSSLKQGVDDKKLREQIIYAQNDIEAGAVLDVDTKKIADKYIDKVETAEGITTSVKYKEYRDALKYHGLLVIAADKEEDEERALIKFRSREKIEEGIEGHKGHTGGDTKKCGSDDSVDGELLVEFLGNSMRESFRAELKKMQQNLGNAGGDINRVSELKDEAKVKLWIRKKSMVNILESFDRKFVTVVNQGQKTYEITVPRTKQESIFLRELGVIKT